MSRHWPAAAHLGGADVQAFEARASDTDLDDLRARLAAARRPAAE